MPYILTLKFLKTEKVKVLCTQPIITPLMLTLTSTNSELVRSLGDGFAWRLL